MTRSTWRALILFLWALPLCAFAASPLSIEPKATLSIPDAHYQFVDSVAMDGDWLVMGASANLDDPESVPFTDVAAYLFQRQSNGSWAPVKTLLTDSGAPGARISVAIRGNLIAIHFGSRLSVFERTANGWQPGVVDPMFANPNGSPWTADIEIEGSTLLVGGGPEAPGGSCDRYNVRGFLRSASGVWEAQMTASSEPATDAACFQSDVATSGNLTVMAADQLADGTSASYVIVGATNDWHSPDRIPGHASPVALENGTLLLGGTEIFRQSSPSVWARTQNTSRADRMINVPIAAELRNKLTPVAFARGVSVFQGDANNNYTEVVRLLTPGSAVRVSSVDLSGRRVVTNDLDQPKAYVFEVPTTFTQPAMIQETFQTGNAPNWTPWAASTWSLTSTPASRVYRQSSLAGDAGSFIESADWTNQSIQADVTPTEFSPGDRWVGLAVRGTDAANYYYITARTTNSLQLKKMVNGAFQTLASVAMPVSANKTYRLRLEAVGKTLRVYVNDVLQLQSVDSTHSHGRPGLLMYKTAANFDNVIVNPMQQLTLMEDSFPFNEAVHWTPLLGSWGPTRPTYFQSSQTGDALSVTGVVTDNQSFQTLARLSSFNSAGTGEKWFGVFARYQDSRNYYYATLRNTNVVSLRKLVNGSIFVLDSAPLTVTPGVWYSLRIEAVKDQVRVYVNGTLVLEATDSSFARGRYGLLMYKAAAEYDNVLVTQP
jgi:hypothetical protein